MTKRGVFLLLEGVDRCGKTTQSKLLYETLLSKEKKASLLHFPDRSTAIGQSINTYLTTTEAMDDHVIHLLFSANRWEAVAKITSLLQSGVNIIMDRYSYSGVAFSAAKMNMTLEWCWQPEVGLPRPDCVIFLDLPISQAAQRSAFGEERYEKTEFQEKVYANFKHLIEADHKTAMVNQTASLWHVVDASKSISEVKQEIWSIAENCMNSKSNMPLQYFTTTEI